MEVHHVGYLTKKLDKALAQFELLGWQPERETKYDPIRKINIAFLVNGGNRVELIEPVDKDSPMYPLLKNYKNTPYHYCYKTRDFDGDVSRLEEEGYRVISPKQEAPCIDGRPVAFLLHPAMGIIELVETPEGYEGF